MTATRTNGYQDQRLPGPIEPDHRLLDVPQVAMRRVLAVQGYLLPLDRAALHSVPARPPQGGRQPLRVELDPHVKVLRPPHDGTSVLALMRVERVARVAVGRPALQRGRLAEGKDPGEQDVGAEEPFPDLIRRA